MKALATGSTEGGFERGVQRALERLLVSPQFLFRIERDPAGVKPGESYKVSDLELASRLSFFLWSSLPDEPLLEAALRSERVRQPGSGAIARRSDSVPDLRGNLRT